MLKSATNCAYITYISALGVKTSKERGNKIVGIFLMTSD